MNFFLTTDLVIGVNEALSLARHLGELKTQKPGIIYDAVLEENLYFRDVKASLCADFPDAVFSSNEFGGNRHTAILKRQPNISGAAGLTAWSPSAAAAPWISVKG